MVMVKGRVLVAGEALGPLLRLRAPISFWGGVDPETGSIADPRHPDHGRTIAGTVLVVPGAVGSSSSSAIVLELLRRGVAPAAILLDEADAILALGAVVAAELGYAVVPFVEVGAGATESWEDGTPVRVGADGTIEENSNGGSGP
jgi:predicted aconitase with swiveling domain